MNPEIELRPASISDLQEMQQLFVDTIKTTCKNHYSPEQIKVWTSGVNNKQRWHDIIENQFVLIAQHQAKIVGYISLAKKNYIDLLYVHPEFQRLKIAQQLLDVVEAAARRQNQSFLTSDVSKNAKPFFEKNGFETIASQIKVINSVEITNYKMAKTL